MIYLVRTEITFLVLQRDYSMENKVPLGASNDSRYRYWNKYQFECEWYPILPNTNISYSATCASDFIHLCDFY